MTINPYDAFFAEETNRAYSLGVVISLLAFKRCIMMGLISPNLE